MTKDQTSTPSMSYSTPTGDWVSRKERSFKQIYYLKLPPILERCTFEFFLWSRWSLFTSTCNFRPARVIIFCKYYLQAFKQVSNNSQLSAPPKRINQFQSLVVVDTTERKIQFFRLFSTRTEKWLTLLVFFRALRKSYDPKSLSKNFQRRSKEQESKKHHHNRWCVLVPVQNIFKRFSATSNRKTWWLVK